MALAFKQALQSLLTRTDLTHEQMLDVMRQVMGGELTPAQIAGFLIALRMKGETVEEISAAAQVMRELSAKVHIEDGRHLVDTCGTGGDGIQTFTFRSLFFLMNAASFAKNPGLVCFTFPVTLVHD